MPWKMFFPPHQRHGPEVCELEIRLFRVAETESNLILATAMTKVRLAYHQLSFFPTLCLFCFAASHTIKKSDLNDLVPSIFLLLFPSSYLGGTRRTQEFSSSRKVRPWRRWWRVLRPSSSERSRAQSSTRGAQRGCCSVCASDMG